MKNQFNKEHIRLEIQRRNDEARKVFKRKMVLLFGEELYKQERKQKGEFYRRWDN